MRRGRCREREETHLWVDVECSSDHGGVGWGAEGDGRVVGKGLEGGGGGEKGTRAMYGDAVRQRVYIYKF